MKVKWILFLLLWSVALSVQFYYLKADPAPNLSQSVGIYVDEGLNTCQARNYVNHGNWGFTECDNLVKSPLYNGYLTVIFNLFGTQRTVARLAILLPSYLLLLLVVLLFQKPMLGFVLVLLHYFQVHVFQYQHIALVESMANAFLPLLLYFLFKTFVTVKKTKVAWFVGACILIFCLAMLKIQYAYLLPLPFLVGLFGMLKQRFIINRWLKAFLIGILIYFLFSVLFYSLWIQPHKGFIEMLHVHQGTNRFPALKYAFGTFTENGKALLWKNELLYFQLVFLLSFIGLPWLLSKTCKVYNAMLLISFLWLLLESHKAFILWLPTRYALSLIGAQFWFFSLLIYGYVNYAKLPLKAIAIILGSVLTILNGFNFFKFARAASWQANEIIRQTNQIDFKGRKAIGVWSTALVWNESAYVLPVWKGFLNDTTNPIEAYRPKVVIGHQPDLSENAVFPKETLQLHKRAINAKTYLYRPFEITVFEFP